jgi:hypothetical protein
MMSGTKKIRKAIKNVGRPYSKEGGRLDAIMNMFNKFGLKSVCNDEYVKIKGDEYEVQLLINKIEKFKILGHTDLIKRLSNLLILYKNNPDGLPNRIPMNSKIYTGKTSVEKKDYNDDIEISHTYILDGNKYKIKITSEQLND